MADDVPCQRCGSPGFRRHVAVYCDVCWADLDAAWDEARVTGSPDQLLEFLRGGPDLSDWWKGLA